MLAVDGAGYWRCLVVGNAAAQKVTQHSGAERARSVRLFLGGHIPRFLLCGVTLSRHVPYVPFRFVTFDFDLSRFV